MPAINELLQQGRYRIIHQSGQDGLGAVYEAYDNVLKTNVTLKEILVNLKKVTTLAQQETRQSAFASEAKILTAIKHESLMHVYDYFSVIDRHFLVMELVEGSNLSELLEKNKNPFPLANVTNWAGQLLDVLNYLHTRKPPIIHGDIKPENVRLTSSGKIKLINLGNAKDSEAKINKHLNNPSFDPATLHALPLEQIWNSLDPASQNVILNDYDEKSEKILIQPLDARSDLYALGALLYELMTAQMPVDALTRSIDTLEGKSDPLKTPTELNQNIPAEISKIVMKALEIKRENRFESAVVMSQALQTALLKVREIEVEEAKKQVAAARESGLAEQKRFEEERLLVEKQRLEIEAEKKRLEQERLRVEQEKLAIEAEKTRHAEFIHNSNPEPTSTSQQFAKQTDDFEDDLFELDVQEVLELNDQKTPVTSVKPTPVISPKIPDEIKLPVPAVSAMAAPPVASVSPKPSKPYVSQKPSSDEIQGLFAEPPKESGGFKKMAIAAVALIALSGAGFGVWSVMSANSGEQKPSGSGQTMSLSETKDPASTAVEATPVPTVEATPETSSAATDPTQPSVNPTEAKNKALAPPPTAPASQPKPQKTVLPTTAKATPSPKKAVTVDDIINDN